MGCPGCRPGGCRPAAASADPPPGSPARWSARMPTAVLPCRPAAATAALLPLVGADTTVPLVPSGTARYVDLDAAASSRALRSVADRVQEALPLYASVHRGAGYLSQVSTALYESARATVGSFVGAREDDVCVFTRHTTDAVNLLAGCVPAGAAVLVLDCEHHADLLPWQRHGPVTVLPTSATVVETLRSIADELTRRPYALVAVTGASNVTGESLPLDDVVGLAQRAGGRVLVDGAQLVPPRRFSLAASGADYVAFSGHKTYAPFGAGVLVGRRDWLDEGQAYLAGGGAVASVTVSSTEWVAAPHRHEGGSPNVLGAVALDAACKALDELPDGALEAHERALRIRLVEGLSALPGVRVLRIWADSGEPTGVVSFTVAGADPGLVGRGAVGRARDRPARRPVRRAPAAGAPRRPWGRAPGQRRGGQHPRRC